MMLAKGKVTAFLVCLFCIILLFICDYMKEKLGCSEGLQILSYLFLLGSLLFGEVYHYYQKIWFFDDILHTLSAFIICSLAGYLLKYFKCKMNLFMRALFIFSFSMMVSVLWEVTEFSIDRFMLADMQKDTLIESVTSELLEDNGKLRKIYVDKTSINDDIILNGYIDIGLFDTMGDIFCAIGGSFVYLVLDICKEKRASYKEAST